MTYMSNSGCCGYGCSSGGSSGYSGGCSGSYSSIDSVISSYSGSIASNLETAMDYEGHVPVINMDAKPETITSSLPSINYGNGEKEAKGYNIPYNNSYKTSHGLKQDDFSPANFLKADRPKAQFVGSVEEIKNYINEVFKATTGKELPEDISIEIMGQDELKQRHDLFNARQGITRWSPGIQGFSINRRGFGQSLIFVKENDLDILMIVIGHEIGHVLNFQLSDKLNEEAKAFAFEMAWMKAIYEKNIAGLKNSINPDPKPAKNGLHDVAFGFVRKLLLLGKDAFDVFTGLMKGEISIAEVGICTM